MITMGRSLLRHFILKTKIMMFSLAQRYHSKFKIYLHLYLRFFYVMFFFYLFFYLILTLLNFLFLFSFFFFFPFYLFSLVAPVFFSFFIFHSNFFCLFCYL